MESITDNKTKLFINVNWNPDYSALSFNLLYSKLFSFLS